MIKTFCYTFYTCISRWANFPLSEGVLSFFHSLSFFCPKYVCQSVISKNDLDRSRFLSFSLLPSQASITTTMHSSSSSSSSSALDRLRLWIFILSLSLDRFSSLSTFVLLLSYPALPPSSSSSSTHVFSSLLLVILFYRLFALIARARRLSFSTVFLSFFSPLFQCLVSSSPAHTLTCSPLPSLTHHPRAHFHFNLKV